MQHFYLDDDEIPADYIRHALHLAQQQGLDLAELLHQAGIPINPLDPKHRAVQRLPARSYERLCRLIQDSLKSYSFSDQRLVHSFQLMCHCIETAGQLRQALERIVRFTNLTHIHGEPMHLEQIDDEIAFRYVQRRTSADYFLQPSMQMDVHILFFWHRFFSWLIGKPLPLSRATVVASEEASGDAPRQLFNCPILFNARYNSLHFPAHYLDSPILQQGQDFRELLDRSEFSFFLISESQVMPIARQVRLLLEQHGQLPYPALDWVARKLHTSVSSLRRHLNRENTSYQTIKDSLQNEQAIILLDREELSLSEIADLLGFTDGSSFQRAFKRWTGQTPGSYRQKLRERRHAQG